MAKINQVSPEKQELFKKLIKEYDSKIAADLQNMLKEMFAPMLQNMLEAELDNSLGYDRYEHTEEIQPNSRNGHSQKTLTTSMRDVEIAIPRDCNVEFEPQVVKKYQRDVSDFLSKF